jgi:transitional endoplasmic reticulum ATPase
MTSRNMVSSALPALGSKLALRLLEVTPSHVDFDWPATLPKVIDKHVRLAKTLKKQDVKKVLLSSLTLSPEELRLSRNVDKVCELFGLAHPCGEIILFTMLLSINEGFAKLYSDMEFTVQRLTNQRILCHMFESRIEALHDAQAKLFELGFVDSMDIDNLSTLGLPYFLRNALLTTTISTKEQLLAPLMTSSPNAQFGLKGFAHINHELVSDYLHAAIDKQVSGVSLLLYGESGNGKTEFARTLAKVTHRQLIEVRAKDTKQTSTQNELGFPFASDERLQSLKLLQTLLGDNSNAMLLIDECESLFDQADTRYTKERLQRFIEQTQVPCIWITNYINWLEPSYIRRFKLVMEVTAPTSSQLEAIIQKSSTGLRLSKAFKHQWAKTDNLTPAVIDNACHVAHLVNHSGSDAEKTVSEVAENTLIASGLLESVPQYQGEMPFDLSFLNIKGPKSRMRDIDNAIKCDAPIRVLLTGPPGTGKTAFAHHLAEVHDKTIIRVSASDVLSKYVGESEQQVSELFYRAHREQAILLLDEVDSLLASRQQLTAQHDVQLVNELLTQLECNTQPVFAATNYAAKLDHAVLRRFDIKLECTYLSVQQLHKLYKQTLDIRALKQSEASTLSQLKHITPGDLAIVARHMRFNPKMDHRTQALSLLVEENRRKQPKTPIGFIAN